MRGRSRYLVRDEHQIYSTRRHKVLLGNAVTILVLALAAAVVLAVLSPRRPAYRLDLIGAGIAVVGLAVFAWNALEWSITRYVITNQRILFIEGLVARRVTALPLLSVIDTTYRRTMFGRMLGYYDLEVNLSGQPGLRKLTKVPHDGDVLYQLVLTKGNLERTLDPVVAPEPLTDAAPPRVTHRLPPDLRGR